MNIKYSITRNQRNIIDVPVLRSVATSFYFYDLNFSQKSSPSVGDISDQWSIRVATHIYSRWHSFGRKQGRKLVIVDQLLQLLTLECWRRAHSSGGPSNYRWRAQTRNDRRDLVHKCQLWSEVSACVRARSRVCRVYNICVWCCQKIEWCVYEARTVHHDSDRRTAVHALRRCARHYRRKR